jgi:hypothetical protein
VLPVVIAMLVILVLSGVVLTFVAFPNRGEELPAAPWLGEVMARAADAAPVLDEEAGDPVARKH